MFCNQSNLFNLLTRSYPKSICDLWRSLQCWLPCANELLTSFVWTLLHSGADLGSFFGGGALVSCSTSKPINHMVFFFWQYTGCIRKPQVISGRGAHPLHPPPRSAPDICVNGKAKGGWCSLPMMHFAVIYYRTGLWRHNFKDGCIE